MSIVTSSSNQTSLDQINEFNQAVSSDSDTVSSETYPKLRLSCASAVLGMANPVAHNGLVAPSLEQLRSKFVNVIGRTSSEVGFKGLSVESLMHALPSGIVILDSYGRIKHSNPAAVRMLGALRQGQYWRELIVEKFEPRVDDGHEVSLKNGLRVNLSTRSLESESGQLIVINNLTETRKLQTQLSRHQRLSSMGKMMSSLAHQIRTPFSAALLHADNLMRRNKQDKAIDDSGRKIISRLRNIERQIRDMLIFAKGETTLTFNVSTAELVENMHESARDLAAYYGGTLRWLDRSEGAMLNCNLDALLGKQMAVDAYLNASVIDQEVARARRLDITQKAGFYGAMDGAIKFVKGDAVAGILILVINLVVGLAIDIMQYQLTFAAATERYALLTIGDGLVAQIPARVLSTSAAILVTRNNSSEMMGAQVVRQMFAGPRALGVSAAILFVMGIVPGMRHVAFIGLALLAAAGAYYIARFNPAVAVTQIEEPEPESISSQVGAPAADSDEPIGKMSCRLTLSV